MLPSIRETIPSRRVSQALTRRLIQPDSATEREREFTKAFQPADVAAALRNAETGDLLQQMDLFEQMEEKDPALSGLMQTRRLAPTGLEWQLIPANPSTEAKRALDHCMDQIKALPDFRGNLIDLFDATGKGISVLEIIWRTERDIENLEWIHPKRLMWEYELRVRVNEVDHVGVIPPPMKVIVHTPKMRAGHPTRGGLLRTLVWAFLFRNFSLKDWSTFAEVYGHPLRIAKTPATGQGEKDELKAALKELASDTYAVFNKEVEIELLEAVDRSNHPYSALYDAMERQYALCTVGNEHTNLSAQFGTRAQTEAGGKLVRQDLLEADCEAAQMTLRRDLLRPLTVLRFGEDYAHKNTPYFIFKYKPKEDTANFVEVDRFVLIDLGLGEHVSREWVAARYEIELVDDSVSDEDRLFPRGSAEQRKQVAAEKTEAGKELAAAFTALISDGTVGVQGGNATLAADEIPARVTPLQSQEGAEAIADNSLEVAKRLIGSISGPMRAIIMQSATRQEMMERLERAYPEMNDDQLSELIAAADLMSRMWGNATAD